MKKRTVRIFSIPLLAIAYLSFLSVSPVMGAEDEGHSHEEHDHDHEGHDHSELEYLYGNHYCPACNYADLVDPHYFADISNKKAGIFARVYLCSPDCAQEIKENMAKYYMEIYRTDKETGKEKPALDLKNETCPISGKPVSGEDAIEYNGMMIGFCCANCPEAFLEDPEPAMRKLLPEKEEYKFPGNDEEHDLDHDHEHEGHDHDSK
ncbi:MAG: hypothetical protein H6751_01490 [Candidatus Omnitrophica bacterium]|nr:hypothetical protein [Candidatus Omnitrophota bacterium]